MLDSLKEELRNRDDNIEALYTHLEKLDEDIKERDVRDRKEIITFSDDLDTVSNILRATLFLMIYNKIEFFIREFILTIYEGIAEKEVSFFNLKDELQENIAGLLLPQNLSKNKKKNQLHQVFMDDKVTYYPTRQEIVNGNIDKKKLKEILNNYQFNAIKINFKSPITLDTLKDIRNSLAHGEKNFSEQGMSYTTQDFKVFKEDVSTICVNILDELEIYLNDQKFLRAPDV